MNDYLEADLHLDNDDNTATVDLLITLTDKTVIKLTNPHHNPVRYHGTWTIHHGYFGAPATTVIPADTVRYFTVVPART